MKNLGWAVSAVIALILVITLFSFNAHLKQKDAQIEGLQAQLDEAVKEANERLQEASLPEATVSVGFRAALISSGNVAQIKNISAQSIAIKVTASRPSTGKSEEFEAVIDPGASEELGEKEGWAFVSGDSVTIDQADHKSKTYTMN